MQRNCMIFSVEGTQDPRFRLGLKIVNARDKDAFLNVAGTTVHIDDRLDCLDSCEASIQTFLGH